MLQPTKNYCSAKIVAMCPDKKQTKGSINKCKRKLQTWSPVRSFFQEITEEISKDNYYRGYDKNYCYNNNLSTKPYLAERLKSFFDTLTSELKLEKLYRL